MCSSARFQSCAAISTRAFVSQASPWYVRPAGRHRDTEKPFGLRPRLGQVALGQPKFCERIFQTHARVPVEVDRRAFHISLRCQQVIPRTLVIA